MIWHTDQHVAVGQRWALRSPEYTWCRKGSVGEQLMVPAGVLTIIEVDAYRQPSGAMLPVVVATSETLPGWRVLFTVRALISLADRVEQEAEILVRVAE